jgi:alpha-D-xyloside xylohydrolase
MMNRICDELRSKQIPCDMLGLEPKWQSHSYPCSLTWAPDRFPDPAAFIAGVQAKGFKLNLWEHAYLDPTAPFHKEILPFTASVLSMGGLVLDPMAPEAVRIYQGYHEREFIAKGVSAFKIDECDRSTLRTAQGWSFPNLTEFPSGIDGEQMGQTYGYLLQKNMLASFRKFNRRTFGNVRASGALAAPLPFVLYSDTYTLADYIRQSCNASFSGLLWSPEFRDAPNLQEFQRRMALVTFSHLFLLNPYYNKLPLWENYKVPYGTKDPQPLPPEEQVQATAVLRHYGNLRMRFLPYLYAAYCEYGRSGLPPIRALVLDFPNDPKVRTIDDSYMFGPSLLVAPFLLEHKGGREVYLPAGTDWYDFQTRQHYKGGQTVKVEAVRDAEGIENIPLFVRANSLIPLAAPVPFVAESTVFQIKVRAYGEKPEPFLLYEDDGVSWDFEKGAQNRVILGLSQGKVSVVREGSFKGVRYEIAAMPE